MTTPTPRKRKLCDFSEATITVIVGSIERRFALHPTVLTNNARYFRGALANGRFKESYDKVVFLKDVCPDVFQVYATYVYSGELLMQRAASGQEYNDENDPLGQCRLVMLVRVYALANYLQDLNLKNKIIDRLVDQSQTIGSSCTVSSLGWAFTLLPVESPLCQLMIDDSLYNCDPAFLEKSSADLPPAYLKGLLIGWAKASFDKAAAVERPDKAHRCKYHEHDSEVVEGETCVAGSSKTTPKKKAKK